MRTTLDIDDEVLLAAKATAKRSGSTTGRVISEWAREARGQCVQTDVSKHGTPLLPLTANPQPVTLEIVNALRDDDC